MRRPALCYVLGTWYGEVKLLTYTIASSSPFWAGWWSAPFDWESPIFKAVSRHDLSHQLFGFGKDGRIIIHYVKTEDQPADVGTKHLSKQRQRFLLKLTSEFRTWNWEVKTIKAWVFFFVLLHLVFSRECGVVWLLIWISQGGTNTTRATL